MVFRLDEYLVTNTAISLTQADGSPAASLEPGTYAVAVDDRSESESFRLVGPGVEEHTQRHIAAQTTWLVTLSDGIYHFFSDRRPESLRGSVKVGSGAAAAPTTTLRGITGSDFAIALVDSSSAPVTRLQRGTYTFEIEDRSPDHNFHLTGPGIERATRLEDVGRVTWTVRLTGGRYSLLCDPHTLTMFRTFIVPAAPVTRLAGSLTAGGRGSLQTPTGSPVRELAAGSYLLTVRDRSKTAGFRFSGPGVRKATGKTFTGAVAWRLELRPGTYRYGACLERRVIVR